MLFSAVPLLTSTVASGRSASQLQRFGTLLTFLRAVYLAIATPTPETSCGLFEINPDVAETLEVVALCRAALGPIVLDFDVNVGNAGKLVRAIRKKGCQATDIRLSVMTSNPNSCRARWDEVFIRRGRII
jgi:hypothetical protein